MKVLLTPDNPIIFIGQTFTLQVKITECENILMWASAQIAGKIKPLKPSTDSLLKQIVHDALGAHENAPFFGHVMSGSRLIATQFQPPKTFLITIKAEGIPPSYIGDAVSISYELRIATQVPGTPLSYISIPITFVGPSNSYTILEKCQNDARFEVNPIQSISVPAPFSLCSMYSLPKDIFRLQEFPIELDNNLLATISIPLTSQVGEKFSGLININLKSDIIPKRVTISLLRREDFPNISQTFSKVIISDVIDLQFVVSRRFSVQIPFASSTDFATNFFQVSHYLIMDFSCDQKTKQWSHPYHLLPPKLTLSTPRSPVTGSSK